MTTDSLPGSNVSGGSAAAKPSRRTFLLSAGMSLTLQAIKVRSAVVPMLAPGSQPPLCLATSRTRYPPLLERFITKLDPFSDDFLCEQYAVWVQEVLDSWIVALCGTHETNRDANPIRSHLSESLHACSMSPSQTVPLRDSGPLRIERRTFDGQKLVDPEKFTVDLIEYFAPFALLETMELEIYGIRVASEFPFILDTDIRYSLVGAAGDSSREQRVGAWHLSWVKDKADHWMVQSWAADPEIRSRLRGPGFSEITGHCLSANTKGMTQLLSGIDHWRTALDGATGIDVYGNHGIAVGDIDGSGYDSFYVCQPAGLPNRLYRNQGDGTFEDVTETSGTGILDGTASALFADFQNRGLQDLLVVRIGGVLLFANMGDGRFEPRPDAFQFSRVPQGTFTSASVADYNRDGFLDVYLCAYSYYKGLNHHQFPAPYYDAQNGPPNFLFRNRGDGTFEDVTQASGMDQNNNRFTFAAAWCDYDNDGWPDLYVANDFGRKNLYRNNGDGTFTDVAAKVGVEDYGPGMSACWLDHDNDGLQDLYVANMWLPEGRRITADDHFIPEVEASIRALYQKHNAGNSFYRNTGVGKFEDKTSITGTAKCGWSWSCASWDFDNDGWDDLYVANGFVSGPNRYDLQSFFWRQVAQRSVTAAGATPDYELAWNAVNELVRSDYSWSGYERNVFFANNHDGTFSDVSGALGLDLVDDSRAFALSDFDHDGRMEFVLKNRTGPQLRILRNNLEGIGNSIIFRLTGHTSNRDAIGATVTIESGAQRQTKFVSAGSGFASQHTKELFFGLGDASQTISISVRWPAGKTDHYDGIPVNHRVQVDEGSQTYKATPYSAASLHAREPSPVRATSPSQSTVSTWLVAPLFGPALRVPDAKGETHQLSSLQGRPVLLTFLRLDCRDSSTQLKLLEQNFALTSREGMALFVVALTSNQNQVATDDLLRSVPLGFPVYLANDRIAGAWNIQFRYLFDRRRDMPLPVSFLLDGSGAIICTYQGVVAPQNVIEDCKAAPTTIEERFAKAMPFVGPYYGIPMTHDYLTFGVAFNEYGYVEEAQAAFLRAIDNDPTHEIAWFNLGTIYLNKKMYSEARKYLSEAARLNPQDSDAWNNLGSISGMEQKYDEALDEFRRAALANPNHIAATQNMMRIYQFQGRAADAQKTLEGLIARAPGIAELHLDLSMALVAQNDLNRARDELETAIKLKPNNPDAINNLGAVLLRMGLSREALERFEECHRLAPDFDRAVINAALLYNRAGQHERSRQLLNEFLLRHPDNAEVRGALSRMGAQ